MVEFSVELGRSGCVIGLLDDVCGEDDGYEPERGEIGMFGFMRV